MPIGWFQALVIGVARRGCSRASAETAPPFRPHCAGVDRAGGPLQLLMVLLGATALEVKDLTEKAADAASAVSSTGLLIGALAAFISGWWACRFMISLVKRNGFTGFAVYCAVAGLAALILS